MSVKSSLELLQGIIFINFNYSREEGLMFHSGHHFKPNPTSYRGDKNFAANKFRRGQISRRKNLVGFLKTVQKILVEFLVTKFVHQNLSWAKFLPPGKRGTPPPTWACPDGRASKPAAPPASRGARAPCPARCRTCRSRRCRRAGTRAPRVPRWPPRSPSWSPVLRCWAGSWCLGEEWTGKWREWKREAKFGEKSSKEGGRASVVAFFRHHLASDFPTFTFSLYF